MFSMARSSLLAAVLACLSILTIYPAIAAGSLGTPVTCPVLTQTVAVDGIWTTASEWTDTSETQMRVGQGNGLGYFRVKHDASYLYLVAESLVDTALEYNSTAGMGDFMTIFLDTLNNQGFTPSTDDYRFRIYYVNPTNTTIMTSKGTGTVWAEASSIPGMQAAMGLDTANSPHSPHPHVAGELRIPLSTIPASEFGFFIRFDDSMIWWTQSDQAYMMHLYWPGPTNLDQSINPSSWGTIVMSDQPIPEFASTAVVLVMAVLAITMLVRRKKTKS